jgi:hypothetical protein
VGALRLLQSFYCFKVVCIDRTHSGAFIMRHMYIQVSKREVIFFLCSFKPNLVIFVCFRMGFMLLFRKQI